MLCSEKMRKSILARLHGYRYEHTLGCERAAKRLASCFGGDVEQAGFAAILHDITKHLSMDEQLALCAQYGIVPNEVERAEPKILHGKTAAAIARAEYDAPDEVCAAIACHTTGKKDMTLLDKILYMADYIEDTRDFDGVDTARSLVKRGIDVALLYCYDRTLTDLIARSKLIHTDTLAGYNDLIAAGVRWH